MQVYSVDTGMFKLDGGAMFGVVPKVIWNKLNPSDENNLCTWAMRCMLIVEGDRKILIDTGMGKKQSEKFFSHYYPHGDGELVQSLHRLGFSVDEITDVILTHLHFDHCGGAVSLVDEKLVPTFPNATYWSNENHWNWAIHPNAREKASFLKENFVPLQEHGQLKFIEEIAGQKSKFSDNIEILFVHGHTKSMMLPLVHFNGKKLCYMADLIPSSLHVPLPYVMGYDMFPMTTLLEKENYLEEAIKENHILFFEHDPIFECCTIEKTEKGYKRKDCFNLDVLTD
jgi:glyoxylase-like metal-dependent hydrolase (beta-lactamase superfamily II)